MQNFLNKYGNICLAFLVIGILAFGTSYKINAENQCREGVICENFEITEINNYGEEIHGEIISSTDGSTGEGIYLTQEYYQDLNDIKDNIQVGDIIKVEYDEDDYKNEVWDNIVSIKILN